MEQEASLRIAQGAGFKRVDCERALRREWESCCAAVLKCVPGLSSLSAMGSVTRVVPIAPAVLPRSSQAVRLDPDRHCVKDPPQFSNR